MNTILKTLFLENPCIPAEIFQFCQQRPEFRAAELEYAAFMDALCTRLGAEEFDAFEDALNGYLAQCANAYYLFGLGIRQDILSALGQAD